MNDLITQETPATLRNFLRETCRIPVDAFQFCAPASMPVRDRGLLAHSRDMTSTLATFHESSLRVEVLRHQRVEELYLREVFLRTTTTGAMVEYGVIGIALEQFTPPQREAVEAGQIPLGALLHQFRIPFVSAPIHFFAIAAEALAATQFPAPAGATCYGRFNRLAKPTGEPLAWILEIIPPP